LSHELLRAARAACDRAGALLIFDEVQTGMGRTGTLWAYEQTPVIPDALTSAKGLGGGLPIGALVTNERLADTFQPGDHGSTFAGGPVACAAALVALEICSDPSLLAHVVAMGERLAAALEELPCVASVRGSGLLVGAELTPGTSAIELARRALLEQRIVINATGPSSLRLEPPLIVTEAQIDEAVERLAQLLP
jgi:acetylornithine/succinyldiaminopimelate/putrescine aminotransferase